MNISLLLSLFLFKSISFIANLRPCLLEGYPCIHSQTKPDSFVSTCCSGQQCQRVSNNPEKQFTCQGDPPGHILFFLTISIFIEYLSLS